MCLRSIPVPLPACDEACASRRAFFSTRARAERLSFFAWCKDSVRSSVDRRRSAAPLGLPIAAVRAKTSLCRSAGCPALTPLSAEGLEGILLDRSGEGGWRFTEKGGSGASHLLRVSSSPSPGERSNGNRPDRRPGEGPFAPKVLTGDQGGGGGILNETRPKVHG